MKKIIAKQIMIGVIILLYLISVMLFRFILIKNLFPIDDDNILSDEIVPKSISDYEFKIFSKSDLRFQIKYVVSNFTDDSMISFKDNITLDVYKNEIRLSKINNTFFKNFGGKRDEEGYTVQRTSDGGYIITGYTASYSVGYSVDVWLIKTDINGIEQWNRTFSGYSVEIGFSVQQTNDGGYIIVGSADNYDYNDDIWLIKTDNLGNMQWNKTYGSEDDEEAFCVQQVKDGGFIIVGSTKFSVPKKTYVWLIKTDNNGNIEWNQTYGLNGWNVGYYVQQTSDGGYIIIGETQSANTHSYYFYLIKTNDNGSEEWNKTYGGIGFESDNQVIITQNSGYIIVGTTSTFTQGKTDVWLIKVNKTGEMVWNKTIGGLDWDIGKSVKETSDGGYIIAAETYSFGEGISDVWLIKVNSTGDMEWNRTFGGSNYDFGYSVDQTSDGGFVITGSTMSIEHGIQDLLLIKTDHLGNCIPTGIIRSINLLVYKDAYSINTFNCSTNIPFGTKIKVQFSQDNINWYDSLGNSSNWDNLINGSNYINLSSLHWNGSNLYYRMIFLSNNMNRPSLQYINLSYTEIIDPTKIDSDTDNIPDSEDTDDDNDNYLDDWEEFLNTNPTNPNDKPLDTDSDGAPDGDYNNSQPWMDFDDDNDGFDDKEEIEADTDPTDPDDYPIKEKDNNSKKMNYLIYSSLFIIIIIILITLYISLRMKRKKEI